MSYFSRYQHGAYEEVWAELLALGEQIWEEPLHSDAMMVARETMQRARYNIETLVPRLVAIGYRFGYGWVQPSPFDSFSYEQRKVYMDLFRWVQSRRPVCEFASDIAQEKAELEELRELDQVVSGNDAGASASLWEYAISSLSSQVAITDLLNELEQIAGTLPLSIRTWYEEVGGVNFVGHYSIWEKLISPAGAEGVVLHLLDPFVIQPIDAETLQYFRRQADSGNVPRHLSLAPDEYLKYYMSGSGPYTIELPSVAADALLVGEWHHTTFVNYLRICFRWGGFPGWERFQGEIPTETIRLLTAGLLPL